MQEIDDTIGGKIRALRRARGLSQEDMSEKLLVARQTISRWEANTVRPDAYNIQLISQFFNVASDYLLSETDCPPSAGEITVVADLVSTETAATVGETVSQLTEFSETVTQAKKKMPPHHKVLWASAGVILGAAFMLSLIIMISILAAPHNDTTAVSVSFNPSPIYICGIICVAVAIIFVVSFLYLFFKFKRNK